LAAELPEMRAVIRVRRSLASMSSKVGSARRVA